jgi:hypothetical protein
VLLPTTPPAGRKFFNWSANTCRQQHVTQLRHSNRHLGKTCRRQQIMVCQVLHTPCSKPGPPAHQVTMSASWVQITVQL